jgi:hypothetical protein
MRAPRYFRRMLAIRWFALIFRDALPVSIEENDLDDGTSGYRQWAGKLFHTHFHDCTAVIDARLAAYLVTEDF